MPVFVLMAPPALALPTHTCINTAIIQIPGLISLRSVTMKMARPGPYYQQALTGPHMQSRYESLQEVPWYIITVSS